MAVKMIKEFTNIYTFIDIHINEKAEEQTRPGTKFTFSFQPYPQDSSIK